MNEFEDLARQLKPRRPPAEWRDLILQHAEKERSVSGTPAPPGKHRGWPGRVAWLALAAIWVVLGFLDAGHRRGLPPGVQTASHATPPAELHICRELVALLSLP
jgi:hypothetical protein